MYSFSCLEPVCCSISRSNCCFLTSIQISQEAGQVVLYSHLSKNFPQLVVIHTVKGFGIVNKAAAAAKSLQSCPAQCLMPTILLGANKNASFFPIRRKNEVRLKKILIYNITYSSMY